MNLKSVSNVPDTAIYEFGKFRLDPANHLLARRDGTPLPLTPRVFDTLLFLVQHSGAVLDKERLMEAVWPDSIVEENNLSQNISTLRRVLGETPGAHRYIDTVPGRGYRFVADVSTPADTVTSQEEPKVEDSVPAFSEVPAAAVDPVLSAASPSLRPILLWIVGALALGVAALLFWRSEARTPAPVSASLPASEKSIAVLPFDNLSGNPENAYFAEGIKDEILTRLAKISALKVISRTSTQKFKSAPENVREIARQLGVANILEGSVQKSGETVRVTVQLINTQSDTHLWAETYDRKLTDLFQVESEVAQRIAIALATTLSGAEKEALALKPTANVEAYQACLKGRYFWNKRTSDDYEKAAEYFRQAVALDPNYAAAYAGLSDACQFNAFDAVAPSALYAQARAAAQKAIALDATLAEPHASLGLLAMNRDWNWPTAENEFKKAIGLNPNYATAHHWYAELLIALDRPNESLAEIKRAHELDPLSLIINTDTGKILYFARRYDEALAQLRETLTLDPAFPQAQIWLGSVFTSMGRYNEALAAFHKVENNRWAMGWLGYVYGLAGERGKTESILGDLERGAAGHPIEPQVLLCLYLGLGDKEQAFAAMEKAYAVRSVAITSLKVNPWYDSLRSDPRFADFLRRTKLVP